MTHVCRPAAQPLQLMLHASDYEQLTKAAEAAGYDVEDFARLALHLYSKATLAAPKFKDALRRYHPLPVCVNVSDGG
ncbi:hypothetical protein R8510_05272 [Ralstonia chuxiongensis]|nr:hypothetical protein R8510_05272 [Ralstonia chuxiongensis]